jgi:TRAP transporter TAXI family solute receptor
MLCRAATLVMMIVVTVFASTAPAAAAAQPEQPPLLIIATGSPGGSYAEYGEGLAKLLTRVLGRPVVAQTTAGSSENIERIEAGDAQLGFVTLGVALEAWNGSGAWTNGRQYREMRALFPMHETAFQFVVPEDSPIYLLADMVGKRIGAGPETGTTGTYLPRFLATLNIDATVAFGTWSDLAGQLERGELDALVVAAGVPFPAIVELEERRKIRYVAPTRDEIVKLRLAFPELTAAKLPPGTHVSLLAPYESVGLYSFAIADKDLPSELAYDIIDAVFTHRQELLKTVPAAEGTVAANFVHNTFLPYHQGALQYYGTLGGANPLERTITSLQGFTITLGTIRISPVTILTGLVWLALLTWLATWTSRILEARVLSRSRLTPSLQLLFSRLMKVVMITAAVFIALGTMGIDLTAFAVFTGAVGVVIGFGLQAIFNNFVAGLILLSEKSLKVGDFVDLSGGLAGTVRQINIRNTTITTPLNVDVVVPNSEFVNGRVTNFTMLDPHARIRVPFGVAYATDCDRLRDILIAAADTVPFTLKGNGDRQTQLWLVGFGESRLEFELVVWLTADGIHRPMGAHAAYCWAIFRALKEHGIEVAMPQRDLHLKTAIPLTIDETSAAANAADARPALTEHRSAGR